MANWQFLKHLAIWLIWDDLGNIVHATYELCKVASKRLQPMSVRHMQKWHIVCEPNMDAVQT